MLYFFNKRIIPQLSLSQRWSRNCASAIALGLAVSLVPAVSPPLLAQAVNPVDQLPKQDQATLREGKVVLEGEGGEYTGRILVTAPVDTTWNVLTDYGNFKDFLPNIVSTQILTNQGSEKVYEQINVTQILVFSHRSRVVIAASESYPSQIAFRLVEGEIKSLQGTWTLEPVAPNQVLITNRVTVDPGSAADRGIFFNIYKSTMRDTIVALKREIERRATDQ
ncbi:SRPBCC family protein [Phormidium tenue FACHB-886]|nr:SRPBCC family protein [Phormidium tenue FACHB-886]